MMRGTPRTFVGTAVFVLDGPVPARVSEAIGAEVGRMPGVGRCDLDLAAGVLLVTAEEPVDRADVLAVLDGLGCRARA